MSIKFSNADVYINIFILFLCVCFLFTVVNSAVEVNIYVIININPMTVSGRRFAELPGSRSVPPVRKSKRCSPGQIMKVWPLIPSGKPFTLAVDHSRNVYTQWCLAIIGLTVCISVRLNVRHCAKSFILLTLYFF